MESRKVFFVAQLFFFLSCSRVAEWILFFGVAPTLPLLTGALCQPGSAGKSTKKTQAIPSSHTETNKNKVKDDQPTRPEDAFVYINLGSLHEM